jgi:hypothetical protein
MKKISDEHLILYSLLVAIIGLLIWVGLSINRTDKDVKGNALSAQTVADEVLQELSTQQSSSSSGPLKCSGPIDEGIVAFDKAHNIPPFCE